ncbi:MAG: hypothetical protein ACE5K0_12015 [Candidatus Methanofastidiosia archaeon]
MKFFEDFEEERNLIFEDLKKYLKSLDYPLGELGVEFLENFSKTLKGFDTFLLFPYWISDEFDVENKKLINRNLAKSSVYGISYFRIQDDVIDEPEKIDPNLLLLANVFVIKTVKLYLELIPRKSEFWVHFENIVEESSNAALLEKMRYSFDKKADFKDLSYMGKKFSTMKIPCFAYVFLEDRALERLTPFSRFIEKFGTAQQIFNDAVGWKDDFEHRQMTYPLFLGLEKLKEEGIVESYLDATLEDLMTIYLMTDIQEKTLELSKSYYEKALSHLEDLNVPYLKEFVKFSILRTKKAVENLKLEKENLIK